MSALARVLVALSLVATLACAGNRPFELPATLQVPRHPCADGGVATCERACNEDADGDACLVASIAHAEGLGGPRDAASMQAFELRACDLGVARGCQHYANNFSRSSDEGELDTAREHYERACRGGLLYACEQAGGLALRLDAQGEPRDAVAALELYARACDEGELGACAVVGDLLTFGIGAHANAEQARVRFRQACEGDDPVGCHNAGAPAEHWLSASVVEVLLERLHAPDPVLSVSNVPSGWHALVVTRTCFAREGIEPVSVHVVVPSGQPPIDAIVLGTLHGWRYRVRPGWKLERPVCLPNVFDIRTP